MSDEPPKPNKNIDWRDVWQKVVTAVAVAVTLGVGTLAWNNLSQGGLIRLLGGVTRDELQKAGNNLNGIPHGAVVAFDVFCPDGWKLVDETVGSAIVGAGATIIGESGSPIPGEIPIPPQDPRRATPPKPPDFLSPNPLGQKISHYVFGIKTALPPNYVPLYYCKKMVE